jgi:hypothetical protein
MADQCTKNMSELSQRCPNFNKDIDDWQRELFKSGDFENMVMDRVAEYSSRVDNVLPWRKRYFKGDKNAIKILQSTINDLERERFDTMADTDEQYKKWLLRRGEEKLWAEYFIKMNKARITELEKHIRQCEIKISVVRGNVKDQGLCWATAKEVPIGDIMGDKGEGKGNRRYYNCPLHGEKNPSFVWYVKENRFKCFGCGAYGDVIDLYMKLNNATFKQAVTALNH